MAAGRRTADFARLAPPDGVMTMAWPDKRMGNFMKNGVPDMAWLCMTNIVARQGNGAVGVVALAGAPPRMVKLYRPATKPMMLHEFSSGLERCLKRTFSWLHEAPAI